MATTSTDPGSTVLKDVDWGDFRDHLPTADQEGKRLWIYPRKPSGRFYRWRTWVSYILLAVLVFGPFIKIRGNPLLMFNVVERKFSVFGMLFYPHDMFIFAIAFLIIFVCIVLFTAVFGRIWCGWLCPQTVLMEMVFRKIEYLIEGDASQQRMLNAGAWTSEKIFKKSFKHLVFFALSFVVGNLLLGYIVGGDRLIEIITDPPGQHVKGLTAMVLFSLVFYGIFARFREQACTFICPYGRFQSVLLDENSIVVAYDHKRGEKRGRFSKKVSMEDRSAAGVGHCIDCHLCVSVCPTGIDIRNGTQMECVNCTACIDACDGVMDKLKLPRGLIRYASLKGIEEGTRLKASPRLIAYSAILLLLCGLLAFMLVAREDVKTTMLRSPGTLYQETADGKLSNLYLVKVMNKTARDLPVELRLLQPEGQLKVAGGGLVAPAGELAESAVLVELEPETVNAENVPIRVGIFIEGKSVDEIKSTFVGPWKK